MAAGVKVPEGFRVERNGQREFEKFLTREVVFSVFRRDDERAVSAVRVQWSKRDGWWWVHPGPQVSRMEGDEARARAVALAMAGDEADRLNKAAGE